MTTVTSRDGTTIAFDRSGDGPALILVGGMFEQRAMDSETAQLAALPLLAQHFTVFHYDRRGRGDSTDTQPYAVEREIEDIEALIEEAGGSAFAFGISSGAALAFEAALALGGKVKKLAMYEAPYNDDAAARQAWKGFRKQLKELLDAGRRGDAVALFMTLLGVPADQLDEMRRYPMWPMWEAVAPTIAYDAAALGDEASVPTERAAALEVPALIMDGGASYPFMHTAATALANAIPNAQHRTLEGQTHEVAAEAIAPVLVEFFNSSAATRATVTLPTDGQILITREFDAPKHLVYKAWTTPELVKRWWSGHRGEMTIAQIDLRVGGRWRYVMVADGGIEVAFHGEYREIVPNERIVSTEVYEMPDASDGEGVLNTVTFTEENGRTTLTQLVQCPSKEVRDAIVDSGMELGMQEQMDLLEQIAISLR